MREFIPTSLGMALIEGFDRMNFETSLGKPFLRKEMELQMKAICEGRTTRATVLQDSISKYRLVYNLSQSELGTLKAVSFVCFSGWSRGQSNAHAPVGQSVLTARLIGDLLIQSTRA